MNDNRRCAIYKMAAKQNEQNNSWREERLGAEAHVGIFFCHMVMRRCSQ
jgi:hypothetical protein